MLPVGNQIIGSNLESLKRDRNVRWGKTCVNDMLLSENMLNNNKENSKEILTYRDALVKGTDSNSTAMKIE